MRNNVTSSGLGVLRTPSASWSYCKRVQCWKRNNRRVRFYGCLYSGKVEEMDRTLESMKQKRFQIGLSGYGSNMKCQFID